ncbi:MAG: UbiA family prenyltransferase [Flavobacteriaceae bacterium]|nr:UbiA family prenyltransferase [Flavobacteriaceae bacterium]
MVFIALYLASIFVFSTNESLKEIVLDFNLLLIVLSTLSAIAGGYIINNFYDQLKDKINKPFKSKIDDMTSVGLQLKLYFTLNLISVIIAYFVSWKAFVFYSFYIFIIWIYSHKLRTRPVLQLIFSAFLYVFPFLALFIYYKNQNATIYLHALFLINLFIIKGLFKHLENIKGEIICDYNSIPIKYGEKNTKYIVVCFFVTISIFAVLISNNELVGYMRYYFYLTVILFAIAIPFVFVSKERKNYLYLHNFVKIIIILGVFSLLAIDESVIINKIW